MKLYGSIKIENNRLMIGGIDTTYLADNYGTPLYVLDKAEIINNCKKFSEYFKVNLGNKVAYASKAFLSIKMAKLIRDEELYLDVVSGGELFVANKAGFIMDKIIFHGNNKDKEEVDMAIKLGVGIIVIDSLSEIQLVNKIAMDNKRIQKVYLRVSPGIEAHTHEYIKTGQFDSKFGIPLLGNAVINAVKQIINSSNLDLQGLHCHIGSQIFDLQSYEKEIEVMITLINNIKNKLGYSIKELDLGGGFGVYYTEEDLPKTIEEYCKAILNKSEKLCDELNINDLKLVIEPGRAIIANCGITLYKIGAIKEVGNNIKYVAVNGGMTDNIRVALYKAKYEAILCKKVKCNNLENVTIVGKCCESGDVLIKDIELPKCKNGDILAVMSTGAYGYSMSSNYNKIPRAAVIMVEEGKVEKLIKRESYYDLIRSEA